MKKSELLLPVGNYQMCLAAIHNGANAIYVGMPTFNARGRSHDHSWDELEEIINTCHLYGVQVHLAFNILIFEEEFSLAISTLDKAVAYGPDALIVQDIGLIKIIKERYPDLTIHGSTQMTVTNHEAIELLEDLNISRFVLGRENSLSEIKAVKDNTDKEIEVFVHGALCVAYSGQCFTSESLGGRSANRGQCAQSCRFDYEIYVDNEKKDLKNIKYLVSPKDLCGINEIPKLQELGVESFKVEGRLKSPEYVATVAKSYSEAIIGKRPDQDSLANMASTYSRGFYSGWLNGVAHQELLDGDSKSHRGWPLGTIIKLNKKSIVLKTDTLIAKGDGILIELLENDSIIDLGERVYDVNTTSNTVELFLGPKIDLSILKGSEKVYLNRRESAIKEVSKSVTDKNKLKRIPLEIEISGAVGEALVVHIFDGVNKITCLSDSPLELAKNRALTDIDLQKGLAGLSNTAYILGNFNNKLTQDIFIHNRELKKIKTDYVLELNKLRTKVIAPKPQEFLVRQNIKQKNGIDSKLNVLIRKKEQLIGVIEFLNNNKKYREKLGHIILDYEFGKDYFSSVKLLKESGLKSIIATTRILKPGEYHNFTLIERCKPDGILLRNLGALNFFKNKEYELFGDFSLNCSNSYTFDYLLGKGLKSLSASYDLNLERLESMMKNVETSALEITIHQYMPEFHMEHCVFAAFLSEGNSFKDCGKPCEKHDVYLKDMYGNRHEIKADQECRNTMFNAKAQSTTEYLSKWVDQGVGFLRFEALHETPKELTEKIEVYLKLLSNELTPAQAKLAIGEKESYGLGVGHLGFKNPYRSRKKIDS